MRIEYVESSESLRCIRNSLKLSQSKMAEIIGCSLRHYQSIESGEAQPTYLMLKNIIKTCNISPRLLFNRHSTDDSSRENVIDDLLFVFDNCDMDQLQCILNISNVVLSSWPEHR